jgi:hypothetical protein
MSGYVNMHTRTPIGIPPKAERREYLRSHGWTVSGDHCRHADFPHTDHSLARAYRIECARDDHPPTIFV